MVLALLSAIAPVSLRGDIAPTKFMGGSLVPVKDSDVSLDDAEVDIEWGTPCKIDARFTLNNLSKAEKSTEIGFPVGAYHPGTGLKEEYEESESTAPSRMEPVDSSAILVELNGQPVAVFRRIPDRSSVPLQFRYDGKTTWYYYTGVLRQGVNSVRVRTNLTPSGVYGMGFRRIIAYCIWTGGRWKGPIGHERVAIHFPYSVNDTTVYDIKPQSGRASGNSLVWDFRMIEPKRDEYDIEAEFLLPSVASKLAEIREAYEKNPHSRDAILRYARHLVAMGYAKGNAGFPPRSFSRADFEKILADTKDPQGQEILKRFYREGADGLFRSATDEWNKDAIKMVSILAAAGYVDKYPGCEYDEKAKQILDEWLRLNPKDSEVWRFYLSNSSSFFFAGQGNMWGIAAWGRDQRAAVNRAFESCPEDPVVVFWHKSMDAGSSFDFRELRKLEGKPHEYNLEFERRREPERPSE